MKKKLLAMFGSVLLISCNKEDENQKTGMYKGQVVSIHHGNGWNWFYPDSTVKPEAPAITRNNEVFPGNTQMIINGFVLR